MDVIPHCFGNVTFNSDTEARNAMPDLQKCLLTHFCHLEMTNQQHPRFKEDTNSSSSGDPTPLCCWRWLERCTDKQMEGIRPGMLALRSLRISISLSPPRYWWFTPSHALTYTQQTRLWPCPPMQSFWPKTEGDTLDGGCYATDLSPRPTVCKEPVHSCLMLRERKPTESEDEWAASHKISGFLILL